MLTDIIKETETSMGKSMDNLQLELAGIRTGKANPALLDSIKVDYYGQMVPLKQVANIAAPDVRLLTLQPWDKTIIGAIEKAILASELGLNPQSDGTLIRLPIPQLTEERRKELVKVKKLEKKHEISEDVMHTSQEEIQKLTDKFIAKVDETVQVKEKEIMEL